MASKEKAWKKTDGPARYFESDESIQLGDRVLIKGWFRKREGHVIYVPGISEYHPEMEYNELYWIGLELDDGDKISRIVNPDTGCTFNDVVFLFNAADHPIASMDDWPTE